MDIETLPVPAGGFDSDREARAIVAQIKAKRQSNMGPHGKHDRLPLVLDCIRKGMTVSASCRAAGISTPTLYEWQSAHPEIVPLFEQAREEGKAALLDAILQHAPKDWRAPAWVLERSYREYAPRYTIDSQSVTVNIEARLAELGVDTDTLSPEARERVIASVTRQLAPPKTT